MFTIIIPIIKFVFLPYKYHSVIFYRIACNNTYYYAFITINIYNFIA